VTQLALERLGDNGRIIDISSGPALQPSPQTATYSMAKAAINAFAVLLALRLGPRRITVNAVEPRCTVIDMNAEARKDSDLVHRVEAAAALRRFGEPADVAAVVALLASPDACWVTGQYIEASGGYGLGNAVLR
jgi:3-oxoacyl-[acyl-carrier protein] reductase